MYFIKNKFDWVLCCLKLFIFNYWYFISSWNQTLCSDNGIHCSRQFYQFQFINIETQLFVPP